MVDRLAVVLPIDDRQHKLLSLLLAGHTDSSAAHRLGVSPRTVTNILRSLMDRLGVDSRFQLGVAIGSCIYQSPACTQGHAEDAGARFDCCRRER